MERYTFSTDIAVPAEAVDLYQWLTQVSDREYQTFSTAHRAMGFFRDGQQEGLINVEDIGGNLLIQGSSAEKYGTGRPNNSSLG